MPRLIELKMSVVSAVGYTKPETELRNGDAQVPAQIKITEGPVLNLHKFVPSEVKINSLPY